MTVETSILVKKNLLVIPFAKDVPVIGLLVIFNDRNGLLAFRTRCCRLSGVMPHTEKETRMPDTFGSTLLCDSPCLGTDRPMRITGTDHPACRGRPSPGSRRTVRRR